ncbi:hypothetical protein AB0K49_25770 [Streptomyces decoyicus]|uniref:hypothetical protein n=1 Tax=Streptomyces decoyicus TaxID=249567 RepID=UPI00345C7FE7
MARTLVALRAAAGVAGALRAVADARSLAERLDAAQGAAPWIGYPLQKHHAHLSQEFTWMGQTREAHVEQEAALFLTRSPAVMTRALLAMDAATCLKADGTIPQRQAWPLISGNGFPRRTETG